MSLFLGAQIQFVQFTFFVYESRYKARLTQLRDGSAHDGDVGPPPLGALWHDPFGQMLPDGVNGLLAVWKRGHDDVQFLAKRGNRREQAPDRRLHHHVRMDQHRSQKGLRIRRELRDDPRHQQVCGETVSRHQFHFFEQKVKERTCKRSFWI